MAGNNEIGKKGELLAAEYLAGKKYKIAAVNWRNLHREIDIIAYDQELLVIVEVKLRKNDFFGNPADSITMKKQRYLISAAEAYLETIPSAPEVRFDIISILGDGDKYKIEHIIDAFNPNP